MHRTQKSINASMMIGRNFTGKPYNGPDCMHQTYQRSFQACKLFSRAWTTTSPTLWQLRVSLRTTFRENRLVMFFDRYDIHAECIRDVRIVFNTHHTIQARHLGWGRVRPLQGSHLTMAMIPSIRNVIARNCSLDKVMCLKKSPCQPKNGT